MKIKYLVQLIFFVVAFVAILPVSTFGQDEKMANIAGQWEGVATQNEGGFRSEYKLQLFLFQKGDSITGRSYVTIDDAQIYVDMEVKGSIHSGILIRMSDIRMIDFKVKEGMEWCNKRYQLVVKREDNELVIEGYWQGDTSFSSCVPGRIYLRRYAPRA
ncbi:MAG: hypothetical protein AAF990_08970 [Bacteroidota bacterium]